MFEQAKTRPRRVRTVVGGGGVISTVLNKAIDLLPFEAHLPGYNYCGPGTRLSKRLQRGDRGINPLDEACKLHDIEYSKYSDSENRRRADKDLASRAWARVKASDSSLGEKAAALAVTAAMKGKTTLGGGGKRRRRRQRGQSKTSKNGKGLYLRPYTKRGGGVSKKRTKKGGGARKRCQSKKKSR